MDIVNWAIKFGTTDQKVDALLEDISNYNLIEEDFALLEQNLNTCVNNNYLFKLSYVIKTKHGSIFHSASGRFLPYEYHKNTYNYYTNSPHRYKSNIVMLSVLSERNMAGFVANENPFTRKTSGLWKNCIAMSKGYNVEPFLDFNFSPFVNAYLLMRLDKSDRDKLLISLLEMHSDYAAQSEYWSQLLILKEAFL